jgi:hypothetical protein
MSACRSCGQEIIWATTPKGRYIPIDPEPDPKGHLVLADTSKGAVLARVDRPDDPVGVRYVSHFATCPHADRHRKR